MKGQAATYTDKIAIQKQQSQSDQALIGRLSQELRGHPIIRSGNWDVEPPRKIMAIQSAP